MYLGADVLKGEDGRPFVVLEGNTCVLTAQLLDELGAKVPKAAITALTLKLFAPEVATQPFLGGTSAGRNILDQNGGAVDETVTATTVTVQLTGADNAIADTTKAEDPSYIEWHTLLIEGTYAGKTLKADRKFQVRNLVKVTA